MPNTVLNLKYFIEQYVPQTRISGQEVLRSRSQRDVMYVSAVKTLQVRNGQVDRGFKLSQNYPSAEHNM